MKKNVSIKLKSDHDQVRNFKLCQVDIYDGVVVIWNDLGYRFVCHLDDVVFCEETPSNPTSPEIKEQIKHIAKNRGKIKAIKQLRNLALLSLKEAKDLVDRWMLED